MAVVTMRQLLESGVHFGHQTRRWNPKMKRFIFTERNGIYIIDLQQSLEFINVAYDYVKQTVAHGGSIMFVGTKKQAQEPVALQAARVGMPYVNQRWLGGMLTNFQTVSKRVQRMRELETVDFDDVAGSGMTKKELLVLRRERDKLEKTLGGLRDMSKVPSAVWIVDTKKEHLAVSEAKKLGIPVIAILDTNCDPDEVDYKIPGNDDAIRSVALLTRVIADAVAEGLVARSGGADTTTAEEPLAEWERELLATSEAPAAPVVVTTAPEAPAAETTAPETTAPETTAPEATATPEVPAAEATEAPVTEAPVTEAPVTEAPVAEVTNAPAAPARAVPIPAAPAAKAPAAPAAKAPAAPAVEAPVEAPVKKADATEADATEADATEADATEADATEADATEADATEADARATPTA